MNKSCAIWLDGRFFMKDEILLQCGDDSKPRECNDEFDITIHCETEKDREDAIRLLKRAERLAWHDVNKEMPEDDSAPNAENCSIEVYVVTKDGWKGIAFHVKGDPEDEWMFSEGSASFGTSFDGVTHWMYQPDAPDKQGVDRT